MSADFSAARRNGPLAFELFATVNGEPTKNSLRQAKAILNRSKSFEIRVLISNPKTFYLHTKFWHLVLKPKVRELSRFGFTLILPAFWRGHMLKIQTAKLILFDYPLPRKV